MLRRPPTTLTITAEDVAGYEDRRASEALLAQQQARLVAQQQQQQQQQQHRENAADSARAMRDERIGVTRRTGR
ncbi:hypothetical protein DCS_04558 [Drechmeria coniospora]|uniref:Anaphase-promoting complex, subunit CDC26 n=1 Tax=Drechmeria coniospora TaxID=98403 RepID=A0A151GKC1_DRECN|nr:hypothetical protein DCS_04558 [Drechmeria coniospora]KYK57547.1 hypothetical protein DCS_04558 [Drechmeria coniospora]ODA79435.1 hypothetical protein RJ55_05028 [Drechmeria coniospora]